MKKYQKSKIPASPAGRKYQKEEKIKINPSTYFTCSGLTLSRVKRVKKQETGG